MSLILTTEDYARLKELIFEAECPRSTLEVVAFQRLSREVARARVVAPEDVPPYVVTMTSTVLVRDRDSGEHMEITVSWPEGARQGHASVLTPLGIALLGARRGDFVEWTLPAGTKRLIIRDLLFQPESAAAASGNPRLLPAVGAVC